MIINESCIFSLNWFCIGDKSALHAGIFSSFSVTRNKPANTMNECPKSSTVQLHLTCRPSFIQSQDIFFFMFYSEHLKYLSKPHFGRDLISDQPIKELFSMRTGFSVTRNFITPTGFFFFTMPVWDTHRRYTLKIHTAVQYSQLSQASVCYLQISG